MHWYIIIYVLSTWTAIKSNRRTAYISKALKVIQVLFHTQSLPANYTKVLICHPSFNNGPVDGGRQSELFYVQYIDDVIFLYGFDTFLCLEIKELLFFVLNLKSELRLRNGLYIF